MTSISGTKVMKPYLNECLPQPGQPAGNALRSFSADIGQGVEASMGWNESEYVNRKI